MKGFFLINKSKGMTSHDVVDILRKVTGERTIGHAGTLDPAARRLLIVAIGREYTKKISNYVGLDKEYEAEIILGRRSTTYDSEGKITNVSDRQPALAEVSEALKGVSGRYEQTPPIYSAKKIKGKKAYELARQGKEVNLAPAQIEIYTIELLSYAYPLLKIRTRVSSGTYIRTLAYDIGQKLGIGAYLNELVRTKIGKYTLAKAAPIDQIRRPTDLSGA